MTPDAPSCGEETLDDIELAFTIEIALSYAPSATWVTTVSGHATAALDHLEALEIPLDLAHIEPQMVMQRSEKD